MNAADLPEGSVVAVKSPGGPLDSSARVYLKTFDDADLPWIYYEKGSIYVNHASDAEVDDMLDGGKALREGYGG